MPAPIPTELRERVVRALENGEGTGPVKPVDPLMCWANEARYEHGLTEKGRAGIAGLAVAERGCNDRVTIQNDQLGGWGLAVDVANVRAHRRCRNNGFSCV
ncbi:MAG: hypothetical protein ACI9K2_004046 [Myxococcota bacterium]|jgi:hypothetical protein